MASTSQMMRTNAVSNASWTSTFPSQQSTVDQSTLFMKKLLAVAVSEIMYLRAIFPEKAFGERKIEDLELKILSETSNNNGACQVIRWMKGCFDALEKQYLRQIMLGIYVDENTPDDVVESYVFRFSYTDNTTSFSCNQEDMASSSSVLSSSKTSSSGIRKATLALLRTTVLLTRHLEPLPELAFLGMKLLYYDEKTPADYEPEGFKSCLTPNYTFQNEPLSVRVGDVTTRFHSMKVRIKTAKSQFDCDDATVPEPTQPSPQLEMYDINNNQSLEDLPSAKNSITENSFKDNTADYDCLLENPTIAEPDLNIDYLLETHSKSPGSVSNCSKKNFNSMGDIVCCPCCDTEDDGLMVQCVTCGYWQHGVCFSVLDSKDAPEQHYCQLCAEIKDPLRPPTDYYLQTLDSKTQKVLCMWRRTLQLCSEQSSITPSQLRMKLNANSTLAKSLMERLENEGLVVSGKGRQKKKKVVKKDALLSEAFPRYLTRQRTPIEGCQSCSQESESLLTTTAHTSNLNNNNNNRACSVDQIQQEVNELVKETKELSVSQGKHSKSTIRKNPKRKGLSDLDLSLSNSQDFGSSSKRQKSSITHFGLQV